MTKSFIKTTAALAVGAAMMANTAFAGSKTFVEEVIIEEPYQWWNAELSTGWDSLYMFRGLNVLRNNQSYGSSLYWTDLNTTFNLSENDFLTIGAWMAFGLGNTSYKEFDAYVSYVRTFGNFFATLGYTFYYIIDDPSFSHELNVGGGYEFDLGFMSLVPGVYYFFNLGPDADGTGFAEQAASYLEIRLDGSIPVYNEGAIAVDPWVSFGTNFRYNPDSNGNLFNGTNNLEFGLALPIQLSSVVSVAPYVAYSQVINSGGILDTRRSTVWGGGAVTFSF
jgi:hypothetical protein